MPAKKDSLWLTGLRFIIRVQQPMLPGASLTQCISGKSQDGAAILLQGVPAT